MKQDIDLAANHFVIGMIFDAVPKSITLSNGLILEYWPPNAKSENHHLNCKRYGRFNNPSTRDIAIAQNAAEAALNLNSKRYGRLNNPSPSDIAIAQNAAEAALNFHGTEARLIMSGTDNERDGWNITRFFWSAK